GRGAPRSQRNGSAFADPALARTAPCPKSVAQSPRLPAPRKSGEPAAGPGRAREPDARLPDQNRTASGRWSQIGNSVGGGDCTEIETTERTGNAACSSVAWIRRVRCIHPGGGSGSGDFLSGQNSIPPSKRESRRSDRY